MLRDRNPEVVGATAYDGFDFEKHKPIVGQPDIVIDKFCIFLDGDRHHANPSKYSDDTIIWTKNYDKISRAFDII